MADPELRWAAPTAASPPQHQEATQQGDSLDPPAQGLPLGHMGSGQATPEEPEPGLRCGCSAGLKGGPDEE